MDRRLKLQAERDAREQRRLKQESVARERRWFEDELGGPFLTLSGRSLHHVLIHFNTGDAALGARLLEKASRGPLRVVGHHPDYRSALSAAASVLKAVDAEKAGNKSEAAGHMVAAHKAYAAISPASEAFRPTRDGVLTFLELNYPRLLEQFKAALRKGSGV